MGSFGYPEFDDYQQWSNPAVSHAQSLASIALASLVVAYTLYKTLEFVGFPVQRWLHRLAEMTTGILGLRGASRSGGMLGSLFGLSPGSLLHKGVRGVADAFLRGPNDIPPGLGNISNSCYQNSVIQGLASLPSLRQHLSKTTSEHATLTADSMNSALYDIIAKLNDPGNLGQHFWIRGKLKSMSVFQQQDAQEYYSKILDVMDEEVKKASTNERRASVSLPDATQGSRDPAKERSPQVTQANGEKEQTKPLPLEEEPKIVPNPLDGLLAQRVGCTSCGYSEGLSLIPFNCVTVSLGREYGYDIRQCLDEYTTLEYIEGVECAKCTLLKLKNTLTPLATVKPDSPFAAKLHAVQKALDDEDFEDKTLIKTLNIVKKNWVQSTKSKQVVVARAPKSLVLHVNRSGFNENTGMPYKNTAGVSYPMVLDLGSWCLGTKPSGSQYPDMSLEEWPRNPKESMLSDEQSEKTNESPFQYRLRAAVTHYGSHGNGHYVCYRPMPRKQQSGDDIEGDEDEVEDSQEEQWWRFSDDTVYAVPESEAHQQNVFMLFYERIDTPVSETSDDPCGVTVAIPMDAPLPPFNADIAIPPISVDEAASIPLPDEEEDDLFNIISLETQSPPLPSSQPTSSSKPDSIASSRAPQPQPQPQLSTPQDLPVATSSGPQDSTHNSTSNLKSETDSSASLSSLASPNTSTTTDTTTPPNPPTPPMPKARPLPQVSPHLMRTAGSRRSQGDRRSLQLVSAT